MLQRYMIYGNKKKKYYNNLSKVSEKIITFYFKANPYFVSKASQDLNSIFYSFLFFKLFIFVDK
jgi:hypothetical protein